MDFSFLFDPAKWALGITIAAAALGGFFRWVEKQKEKKEKKQDKADTAKLLSDAVTPIIQHVEENKAGLEETKVLLENFGKLLDEVQSERDYYRLELAQEREERRKGEAALLEEIAKIKQERTRESLEYQATIKQLQTELVANQATSQQLQGELEQVKAQLGAALALNEEYIAENKQLKARLDKRSTSELNAINSNANDTG